MKSTYHICMASHDEVMFRNETDLIIGFNYLAYTALETDSAILADGFLPTHHHEAVRTSDPDEFARRSRYAYTRYFNAKYFRKGSLGEKKGFILEVDGLYHTQAMLSYVIRQGLHHGLASTPFGYPHCSANAIFRGDLGKELSPALINVAHRSSFLPFNCALPIKYRMAANGCLLREDIEDIGYVESIYVSPRNYLYQMNRISDSKDFADQQKENSSPVITLETIEKGVAGFDPGKAFVAEQGRVNRSLMTDIELCGIIDNDLLKTRYSHKGPEPTIYLLSDRERTDLGNWIWKESKTVRYSNGESPFSGKTVTANQIRRCLCIK